MTRIMVTLGLTPFGLWLPDSIVSSRATYEHIVKRLSGVVSVQGATAIVKSQRESSRYIATQITHNGFATYYSNRRNQSHDYTLDVQVENNLSFVWASFKPTLTPISVGETAESPKPEELSGRMCLPRD